MRKPFVAQIEGHEVSLTQDDCAIMMETSALRAITETLFVRKEKRCQESNSNLQQQNKRQRTNNGNQTVRTERGANGLVALYQTERRNNRLSKQALQQERTKLNRESKNIVTTLTLLAALTQKKPDSYWVFLIASSQQEMTMILCLLAPDCRMISKGKQEQWQHIQEKLVPMLSQAVVDAKGEDYSRRLAAITAELAALVEEEDLDNDDPIDQNAGLDLSLEQETSRDDNEESAGQQIIME